MEYSYLVFAPPLVTSSAGIRYLHNLVDDIRMMGFRANFVNDIDYKVLGKPIKSYEEIYGRIDYSKALMEVRFGKVVAIYPEVVCGNPLGASRVVRLVANKPGYLGGDRVYHDSEKVYLYSKYYSTHVKNEISGFLYNPMLEINVWTYSNKGERPLKLFYVGKGKFTEGYTGSDYIEITRSNPTRAELPALFNRASHIVVFDNSTALIQEAALCGCIPIVIPDGSQSREDFEAFELGMNGVAWGIDDYERAKSTLHKLRAEVERASADYQKLLSAFLVDTQENWPAEASKYDDSVFLGYASASYERDRLRELLRDMTERFSSLAFAFGDEPAPNSSVIVWGAGSGAQRCFQYLWSHYQVKLVTGADEETPKWLGEFSVNYVPSKKLLAQNTPLPVDSVLVASQYREQIREAISSSPAFASIPVYFMADYMLV
jgi:hypothetical protein